MKFKIVYFDDQIQNIEVQQLMLKDHFDVLGFTETSNFEKILRDTRPHGVLLDYHMPNEDGLQLFDKIVKSDWYNGCPIFFISGDDADETRLKTIQNGAIDFFERKIGQAELVLRLTNKIKIFLRGAKEVSLGNLEVNTENFTVKVNGKSADLTLIETRILFCIVESMPGAIDKTDLMMKIWRDTSTKGKLSVHLSNIKSKLWGWDHEIKVKDSQLQISPVQ